ncbi:MAG: TatD family hydrolase [Microgenomates group bacterium]
MLIDTHAHLWFDDYRDDLEQVLERAKNAGVEKMIVPGTEIESNKCAVELAKRYPDVIYAAVGIHPEELLGSKSSDLSFASLQTTLRSELREHMVAIGEIGTDASTEELKNCMGEQKELFRTQCELALQFDLPIIVHTRQSLSEALEVLDKLPTMPRGQFHCFSHDEVGLKQVIERGFNVSFCGNITWSKRVARLVSLVPDNRLLLETDSPLMMPMIAKVLSSGPESSEPRNRRNEPANVTILAQIIADLRGQSLQVIADQTTQNAVRLFKL